MEELLIEWLKEHGFIVLFLWSVLQGQVGLIMGGVLCHTGDLQYPPAVLVAGLGGFTGNQLYFYVGRFNKGFIQRRFHAQRRKFAIAHLLLNKYGWALIFIQRYLHGLRAVIPISIGITRYSARKFALINLVSALLWAAATITPAYLFGEEILTALAYAKKHWYYALPVTLGFVIGIIGYLDRLENRLLERRGRRRAG